MKKILLLLLLLAVVAGSGWYYARHRQPPPDEGRIVLYGNVDIREALLAFNGSEHIREIRVEEGAVVEPGQLLASLDKDRLLARVEAAEARVEAQRQLVARMEAGSRPEEIREARARLAEARAAVVEAEARYKRIDSLARRKLAPVQELDAARAALDRARARERLARATLDLVLAGPRREDIARERAVLKADEAGLALARSELADADLHAPVAGTIRDRILEPGDFATPQRPVFTLAFTSPVWVRVYAAETELGKIRPGMPAVITTDSFPGKSYPGWVGYISPTAEFTPKSVESPGLRTHLVYQVRVYACNPQGELRLGMPATVTIDPDAMPLPDPQRRACQ